MDIYPICVKTPKGLEEVERRTQGLPLKARQVLIMVDGRRDLAALQGIFPPETVRPILDQLLGEGFIRGLDPPPAAPAPAPVRPVPVAANDAERFDLARNFMRNTTATFLGVVGSSLTGKIEGAADLAALGGLYGEWHDALAISADGRKRLPELGAQLFDLLGGLPAAAPAPTPSPARETGGGAPAPRPRDDDERLSMARAFMVNTTVTFLGVAASSLIDRLEAAASIAALRQHYYDWREAMHLSAEAKPRLPDFERRLAALLS